MRVTHCSDIFQQCVKWILILLECQTNVLKLQIKAVTFVSAGILISSVSDSGPSSSGVGPGPAAPRSLGRNPRTRVARNPLINIH
jgi:hypothetical protein